jgi:hypothetical protein
MGKKLNVEGSMVDLLPQRRRGGNGNGDAIFSHGWTPIDTDRERENEKERFYANYAG